MFTILTKSAIFTNIISKNRAFTAGIKYIQRADKRKNFSLLFLLLHEIQQSKMQHD